MGHLIGYVGAANKEEYDKEPIPLLVTPGFKLGKDGLTHATMEIEGRYAPLHVDDHVILRQKTLLGETYVQIKPGPRSAPALSNEAELAHANVERFVTLDDILSTFDHQTQKLDRLPQGVWHLVPAEVGVELSAVRDQILLHRLGHSDPGSPGERRHVMSEFDQERHQHNGRQQLD